MGYNHDDIIVCEETSIAEKIIKLFPKENIVLTNKFNNRKPDIWFKDYNIIIEVDEGNHENYDSDDEKEREDMFKNHNFKIFRMPKTFYEITKNEKHKIKNKANKKLKNNLDQRIVLGALYTQNFWPEKVKMTNKILKKNLTVLFVGWRNQDF